MSIFNRRFFTLFLATLTLSSCGGGLKDHYTDEGESSTLEGILTEQSVTDSEAGTHFLELDSGDKQAVNSLEINLSDIAYLENLVKATGVLNEEEEIFTVTGISVLEILSDVKAEVVEFTDYDNDDLGFSLKYYNDWRVGSGTNTVIFTAPKADDDDDFEPSDIVISQSMFNYEPSVDPETGEQDSPLEVYKAEKFAWVDDFGDHMVKVGPDQLDAIRVEEKAGAIIYYLYRFGLIYEVKFEPGENSSAASADEQVIAEMLAEFKFTPFEEHGVGIGSEDEEAIDEEVGDSEVITAVPDIDVKTTTFESLLFEFSGKLPSDWYYAGSSATGALHHYGFSDEVVESDNEIIGLDILAEDSKYNSGVSTESKGSNFFAYTSIGGQTFKVFGPSEYSDLIMFMADSLEPLDSE
jgi:hypothetical protein